MNRGEWRELAVVTAAFAVLTALMTLPFSLVAGSHVVADLPDTHLFVWTLAWDTHAFLHQPLGIFDANIYYPFPNTLAYSENLIGTAFFAAPVIWLTGNMVLAMNLAALLTCVLCGTGAYLLARRLQLSMPAAFVCGVIFAFAPPRFIRLGQLHLTAVQWIPFSLAFLHSYFDAGRRRDLLLATACFTMQVLASGHGAAFLALAILLLLAWEFTTRTPLAFVRRVSDFGLAGIFLIAPSLWIMIPYQAAQDDAGLRRGYLSDVHPGIESLLASPTRVHQLLHARFIGTFDKEPDAYLFPGILVLLLAALAVALWPRRSRIRAGLVGYYVTLGTLSTLMFVDWPFEIWRHVYWMPGFNFIRMPSRFMILTTLVLAVLAAIAFERLSGRARPFVRNIAAVILCAALLAEYVVYPFAAVPYEVRIPSVDRWLDSQPKPFAIAEVPVPSRGDLGALERQQTQSMLHATAHWQKTVHGYSGIRPPFHDTLYDELTTFPSTTSLAGLRAAGVTYVVVHTEEYGSRWPSVEQDITRSAGLQLVHSEGDGRVYRLLAQ